MPSRSATVEFADVGDGISIRLLEASVVYDGMLKYAALTIDPAALPPLKSRQDVTSYGVQLRRALGAHLAIDNELTQMFGMETPNEVSLHLAFSANAAEAFRWEALCATDRFLALSNAATVRRIPLNGATSRPALRLFSGPIRLLAFLSAAGIDAKREFEAIAEAVAASNAAGLPVEATIFLGQQDLLDDAQKRIDAGTLPHVAVAPIPAGVEKIEDAIRAAKPQLLHFFCHGRSELGERLLELASITDHDADSPTGSVFLSIQQLVEVLVATGSVWATVLNSCNGALAMPSLHSMARTLVERGGSPNTVGMAEEITEQDATLFAREFYAEMFDGLRQALDPVALNQRVPLDFSRAVARARQHLHATYEHGDPDCFGHWCLPLLYQTREPLRVARVADAQIGDRIVMVAQALRGMADSTPTQLRVQMLKLLETDPPVPPELRPDLYGNLA